MESDELAVFEEASIRVTVKENVPELVGVP